MSFLFSHLSAFANSPKIIVVGGGIGGLTTAYRLHQNGMNVDLYEARSRLGGRIFTAKVNGHSAELGGQNITDGGEAVYLHHLIHEFGLQCASSRIYLKHSYFNGIDLTSVHEILRDQKMGSEVLKKKLDSLASTCLNMKEVLEEIVSPQDPLYKILSVRMAAYEGGPIEKLSTLYTETLFHMLLGGICSAHPGDKEADTYNDWSTSSLLPS